MRSKTSRMKKILAFVVTVAVLFTSLPMYAFATLINNTSEIVSNEETIDNALTKSEVVVLEEDETLRDENTKHFKLSDGTTKAVVYSQAVHYKDADGKWVDIDNALTLNGSEYSSNNKSEIKFANKSGSNGLVSIKDGDYKIDFTPLNTNKVSVVIENPQSNNSRKFEDISVLNNLVSKAIYADIYDGIDIEYILVGNNIKENIIVKEKQDSYTFSFELKLNKLSAELVNGAIILSDYDSGEQVYEIPVPYMFDANGEFSTDVEYSLTQNNKWKYTFTVSANAEWINSVERAFPVTIDPTIGVETNVVVDATEYSNIITSTGILIVGNGRKTQISFSSIPTLPKDAYLTDATISLKHMRGEGVYVGAYQYNTERICDYNIIVQNITINENGVAEYNGTYGDDGWYTWNIYDIVYDWYNKSATKALELKAVKDTSVIEFESKETSESNRPVLEITYCDMKGIEPYWSYITQNAGLAGNGAVNLATGNLVFEIPTLTTTDSLFGYTPTMIYNSAIVGEAYKYSNAQIGYWGSYAANGYKVSYNEALIKDYFINSDGEEKIYYIWADSDGTEHYFFNDGETNIYRDEDGLQLTLTVDDSDITRDCIIRDSEFNSRIFAHMTGTVSTEIEATWYLSKIQDKNGNELYFQIDGSKRPNDVKVIPNGGSAITMISPLYNSNSAVTLFWNNATKEAVLLRHSSTCGGAMISTNSGLYLREVIHLTCDSSISWTDVLSFVVEEDNETDGITINSVMKYDYDGKGRLYSVNNTLSDYTLWYAYDESGRVVSITEEGGLYDLGELGQAVEISYFAGYTEVRTSGTDDVLGTDDDLINVYSFDNQGRAVTTYTTNTDRSEIYGLSSGTYDEGENSKNSIKTQFNVGTTSANYILNGNFEDSIPNNYWHTIDNVTTVTDYSSDKCDTTRLKLPLKTYKEAYAWQYVYLKSGTYTLSLDVRTDEAEDVELTLTVGNQTEIVPISHESSTTEDYFATATFDIDAE